jgi:hypothetical protein
MTRSCNCTTPLTCCSAGYHSKLDARRPPFNGEYWYDAKPCNYVCIDTVWVSPDKCPKGNECLNAHTLNERCFHPASYKHALCLRETCPWGAACSLAHGRKDIRATVQWQLPITSLSEDPSSSSSSTSSPPDYFGTDSDCFDAQLYDDDVVDGDDLHNDGDDDLHNDDDDGVADGQDDGIDDRSYPKDVGGNEEKQPFVSDIRYSKTKGVASSKPTARKTPETSISPLSLPPPAPPEPLTFSLFSTTSTSSSETRYWRPHAHQRQQQQQQRQTSLLPALAPCGLASTFSGTSTTTAKPMLSTSVFGPASVSFSSATAIAAATDVMSVPLSAKPEPEQRFKMSIPVVVDGIETKQLPYAVKKCGECEERYAIHVCLHCAHILCTPCSDRLHPLSRLQAPHARVVCARDPIGHVLP